jgi:hypothetical protein
MGRTPDRWKTSSPRPNGLMARPGTESSNPSPSSGESVANSKRHVVTAPPPRSLDLRSRSAQVERCPAIRCGLMASLGIPDGQICLIDHPFHLRISRGPVGTAAFCSLACASAIDTKRRLSHDRRWQPRLTYDLSTRSSLRMRTPKSRSRKLKRLTCA